MYKSYKFFVPTFLNSIMMLMLMFASEVHANSQNMDQLMDQAVNYLVKKTGNNPETLIQVLPPDTNLDLPACDRLDFISPASTRTLNGNIRLGVKCSSPLSWTIYLNAKIQQKKEFVVSRYRLRAGQIITPNDLAIEKDYPENLPYGYITDPQVIVGKSVIQDMEPGTPMVSPGLKTEYAITFGQNVRILANGPGFKISSEGKAMGNATLGQNVQVKVASGQLINGIARTGGIVEIPK